MRVFIRNVASYGAVLVLLISVALVGCPSPSIIGPPPVRWPIAKDVYTTAEQQILPVGLSVFTPQIDPWQVPLYDDYGYSDWLAGNGTDYGSDPENPVPHDKRTDLAPDYIDAENAARLLTFFAITDIHITDKESPAQPIRPGWTAPFGPTSAGLFISAYSPIIMSTTHVLDAAIQTVNALHKEVPFDFGISLGDNINNNQYNELRWFIDVLDGKVITPSSGAHDGQWTIDYQKPYLAAGLNREIPWYQVIGNHDKNWSGIAFENTKTRNAHTGKNVINIKFDLFDPNFVNETEAYMGVVDGTTPYGDVIKEGLTEEFEYPPTVVSDDDRHALSTDASDSLGWMSEFFDTCTKPKGHGFTQSSLDNDFACYSFEPKSDLPLKIIVLDTTSRRDGVHTSAGFVGSGALDQERLDWLLDELQAGQDEDKLMIIAAHMPIRPNTNLTDTTPSYTFFDHAAEDALIATLHNYPNLIMWVAGHRHLNTVTPMEYDSSVPGQGPENSFWEVETSSLREFPQQLRTFDIRRNTDNTISIFVTNVDPAVAEGSPAAKSRDYAIGAFRLFGATPEILADTSSHVYNAELVKQLTPDMQTAIASCGTPLD
ncbi:MAG: TIGR03768 family metallophosphoesterase [Candidatus Hydrogenedentales bacterium]